MVMCIDRAMRFQVAVVRLNIGVDSTLLSKQIRASLFSKYLSGYSE